MSLTVLIALLAASAILFALERLRVATTLSLHVKGDIKRESRWLAQYGQSACTAVAALLVWDLDPQQPRIDHLPMKPLMVIACVAATSLSCLILKRTLGRVRPGRENAGRFLGPSWGHANHRESFPSSHSACAVALSTALTALYPSGIMTFVGLAIICSLLRYLLDAHWLSDVLAGCALGYAVAHGVIKLFPL